MAHQITTIGDLDVSPENMATSQIFAGATNRAQIGAYLGALAWEKSVKGATVGFVAGVLLAVGVGIYLHRDASNRDFFTRLRRHGSARR